MSEFKKTRKRIRNPVTGKYYAVRQKSTSAGTKGEIKGLWKNLQKKSKKSRR